MRKGGAWLAVLSACACPALVQAQPATGRKASAEQAFTARLIAEAGAQGVFADAATGASPQARHLASGVVCRFVLGQPASIKLLPAKVPADNVGCTMKRGSGILALQVQRVPEGVKAAKFLEDMAEVVRADFPDAGLVLPPNTRLAAEPGLPALNFEATFQGRPVYVEVTAARAGPWMISGHMVAPRQDAESADRITRAEVEGAARQVMK